MLFATCVRVCVLMIFKDSAMHLLGRFDVRQRITRWSIAANSWRVTDRTLQHASAAALHSNRVGRQRNRRRRRKILHTFFFIYSMKHLVCNGSELIEPLKRQKKTNKWNDLISRLWALRFISSIKLNVIIFFYPYCHSCCGILLIESHQKRHRTDDQSNRRQVEVLHRGGWLPVTWQQIAVGNFVRIRDRGFFPADLVLLFSRWAARILPLSK